MNEPADDLIILEPTEMLLPYAELGEGPHWDIPTQTLYWVDVPAQRVHSMDADEKPGRGKFYRFDTDHSVTELYDGIGISNGLGWSPDDKRMYYIDSFAYRVDVVDYDVATGQMGERQAFARLGSGELVPDGLAVDSQGGVWVAVWGGSVIQRYDADARLTSVVKLPAAHVTSCAFGGPDLTELFITTAAGPGRSAGALFTCPAGVKGLPAYSYQG